MSRLPVVAGNWKMNGDLAFVRDLVSKLIEGLPESDVQTLVFPPFVYLQTVHSMLSGSQIELGAQSVDWHESGAYTGEVAPQMVKDAGCGYCLVGHSERRSLYGETNGVVAKKFAAAHKAGLVPLLCLGETLKERQDNRTREVVAGQLKAILDLDKGIEALRKAVIAYEPVWAIGTGESASPDQAEEVHGFIREMIAGEDGQTALELRILYGGSVNPENAGLLFDQENIDGALVGGASLKAPDFIEICRLAG